MSKKESGGEESVLWIEEGWPGEEGEGVGEGEKGKRVFEQGWDTEFVRSWGGEVAVVPCGNCCERWAGEKESEVVWYSTGLEVIPTNPAGRQYLKEKEKTTKKDRVTLTCNSIYIYVYIHTQTCLSYTFKSHEAT